MARPSRFYGQARGWRARHKTNQTPGISGSIEGMGQCSRGFGCITAGAL
ncbi:hypothetical protein [Erythrobacter insulae]|nr:hypothetical protein [Erythrobacter insulae]